jgi:hypothetical protein
MTVLGAVLMVAGLGSAASAQDEAPDAGQVDVLEVAGYLDPVRPRRRGRSAWSSR